MADKMFDDFVKGSTCSSVEFAEMRAEIVILKQGIDEKFVLYTEQNDWSIERMASFDSECNDVIMKIFSLIRYVQSFFSAS